MSKPSAFVSRPQEAGGVEIEAARARGREMVDEALLVRSRVLEDLARKRKASRVQLERLQAGRERLIDSYTIVQRTLDEAKEELRTSLTSAKIAADAAARRVEAEPMPSPSELEREVEAARAARLRCARARAQPGTARVRGRVAERRHDSARAGGGLRRCSHHRGRGTGRRRGERGGRRRRSLRPHTSLTRRGRRRRARGLVR